MSDSPFALELATATQLVQQASALALAERRAGLQVGYKGQDRGNVVTQADVKAGEMISQGLARCFPTDAILNEEDSRSHAFEWRASQRRLWCIDPIDGTRGFAHGGDEFAVMVGLAIDGEATLGVVAAPASGTLWQGVLGPGSWRLARRWHETRWEDLDASGAAAPVSPRLVVSSARPSRLVDAVAERLGAQSLRQRLASVGLKAMQIAEGRADIYVSPSFKTHEWDACAPEAIVRASGGAFTDLVGEPLRYNKPTTPTRTGLMASHGRIHQQLTEAVTACWRRGSSIAQP